MQDITCASDVQHPAPQAPLGTFAKSPSAPQQRSLCDKWAAQDAAAQLMPGERVKHCCRTLNGSTVQIVRNSAAGVCSYRGLQTCGSVWHCPVCASKVSEHRRRELGDAVARWRERGGEVVHVVYTIRHRKGDDLVSSVDAMLRARASSRSGRWAVAFTARFGLVGSVRALEVTHGRHGWHPHLHELMFVRAGVNVDELRAELLERWASMVGKQGLRDVNEHGIEVTIGTESIGDYVSKHGAERSWGVEHELTKAVRKESRGEKGRTPSALLRDYIDGDGEAGELWRVYARAFKGRRQLVWSRGLRELLDLGEEKSDEELAAQEEAGGELVAELEKPEWAAVVAEGLRGQVLKIAADRDHEALVRVIRAAVLAHYGGRDG